MRLPAVSIQCVCVCWGGGASSVRIFIILGDLKYVCEKQNKISENKYPRDRDMFSEIHYLFPRIIKVSTHLVQIS